MYLEWSPSSDEFEYIIKVLYDFSLLGFHDCCLSFTFDVSALDARKSLEEKRLHSTQTKTGCLPLFPRVAANTFLSERNMLKYVD